MAWIYLVIAGGLEVFWSTCMKFSNGFTEAKFTVLTIIGMIFSFLLLSQATKTLPLGTAYGIWTGIGAVGAVIVGIFLFKEPVTAARIFFEQAGELPSRQDLSLRCTGRTCSGRNG